MIQDFSIFKIYMSITMKSFGNFNIETDYLNRMGYLIKNKTSAESSVILITLRDFPGIFIVFSQRPTRTFVGKIFLTVKDLERFHIHKTVFLIRVFAATKERTDLRFRQPLSWGLRLRADPKKQPLDLIAHSDG